MSTAVFGVHPVEPASRAHTGLRPPALERLAEGRPDGAVGRLEPVRMAGQVLMTKRPGTVRGIPATPQEPWVEFYGVFAEPGEVLAEAALSSDFLAAAVLSAATREECEKRCGRRGAFRVGDRDRLTLAAASAPGPRGGTGAEGVGGR
ncbi:hypothetical protein [Streptomyces sp. A1136]|uniref:hypothetical protein n=1 Tax=Streptomyces sp. A1136 TaxID=2563102 RepID=UPI00109E6C27|nr:hypothetical protein [Streptomyces sp. A1136]THA49827.1 hypothetical protein E6R62_27175 [Streptomyces sp. A1136]